LSLRYHDRVSDNRKCKMMLRKEILQQLIFDNSKCLLRQTSDL
jgi:hypothetical protein